MQALDLASRRDVAVKIIRREKNFFEQAKLEVQILRLLNERDPKDERHVVRLLDTFNLHGHFCMVFELLSYNLCDFLMKKNGSLSIPLIRHFAFQILTTLEYLQRPGIEIIHCDLKPENVVLVSPQTSLVKVIDFGSSCTRTSHVYKYIQSRYYRSPEVVMGLPYSFPIDIWSLGCLLPELLTTEPLFPARNEVELLVLMGALIGMPPDAMIQASHRAHKLFVPKPSGVGYDFHPTLQPLYNKKRRLAHIVGLETGGPLTRLPGEKMSRDDLLKFIDLVSQMLRFDPATRITPAQALQHPFFQHGMQREIAPPRPPEKKEREPQPAPRPRTR